MNRKWGVRHLLTGWAGYWIVLAATTLAQPLSVLWRVTRLPEGSASASAGFSNDIFTATISSYGKAVWTGTASLAAITFWICGPPLLMWLGWIATRSRADSVSDSPAEQDAAGNAQMEAGTGRDRASLHDTRKPELPLSGLPLRNVTDVPRRVATPIPARDQDAS